MTDKLDTKAAREVLQQEAKARIEAASSEIAAVLEKYSLMLDASIVVTARGNVPQIQLIPKIEQ